MCVCAHMRACVHGSDVLRGCLITLVNSQLNTFRAYLYSLRGPLKRCRWYKYMHVSVQIRDPDLTLKKHRAYQHHCGCWLSAGCHVIWLRSLSLSFLQIFDEEYAVLYLDQGGALVAIRHTPLPIRHLWWDTMTCMPFLIAWLIAKVPQETWGQKQIRKTPRKRPERKLSKMSRPTLHPSLFIQYKYAKLYALCS